MEKRTAFVIFDPIKKMYATRKNFTSEFSDCRIYKEKHHAENCVKLKHPHMVDVLAIVPIEVTIDPYDQFSAVIGAHAVDLG